MRLFHVTDLHFDKKVCEQIKKEFIGDALFITGDLFDDSVHCSTSIEQQVIWYKAFLKELPKPVFICSGNHDVEDEPVVDDDWNDLSFLDDEYHDPVINSPTIGTRNWVQELAGEGIFIDGSVTDFMGYKIGCVGYNCEELFRFHECDILLHHVPPSATSTALQGKEDWGCSCLSSAILHGEINPKIVLCGHVHRPQKNEAMIASTRIINPGKTQIDTLYDQGLIAI